MEVKEFYNKNKNSVTLAAAVLLLYAVARFSRGGYTLNQKQWEALSKNGGILNPLKGRLVVTSGYGYRSNPKTGQPGQFHNGTDLVLRGGNSLGAPVYAPYGGKIVVNEWNAYGGGNQLIIDSGYAKFGFAHLLERSPLKVGDIVKKGQMVGKLGNTGTSTGAHLHFTLRLDDKLVDALKAMPGLKKSLS